MIYELGRKSRDVRKALVYTISRIRQTCIDTDWLCLDFIYNAGDSCWRLFFLISPWCSHCTSLYVIMDLSYWFKLLQPMGLPALLCVLHQHKENSSERWLFGSGSISELFLSALPLSLPDPSSHPQWNDFHLLAAQGTRGTGRFTNAGDPSDPRSVSPSNLLSLCIYPAAMSHE